MTLDERGFPVVGTHCLCDGLEVWICGYNLTKVWMFSRDEGDVVRLASGCKFAPIKTKRDELLEEMIIDSGVHGDDMVKVACENLLDAGYHK